MTDLTVAKTILGQLGGDKAIAMIGMTHIVGNGNSLRFSFKGCPAYNVIKIILEPNDTYTIEYYKYNPKTFTFPLLRRDFDVYCNELINMIEFATKLKLSLGSKRNDIH